jgi:hypothetical protein
MRQQLFHKRFIMSEQPAPIGNCYRASGKNIGLVVNTSDSNKRTGYICKDA